MPHSKTSKKRTHKRRRRGGGFLENVSNFFSSFFPGSLLGGTPEATGASSFGEGSTNTTQFNGGKTRKTGKNIRKR